MSIVTLGGYDIFSGTLVMGTNGSGKTSRILLPMAAQVLDAYRKGNRCGLTVVEPKGDFCQDVYDIAKAYRIPVQYIDPRQSDFTKHANVLLGNDPYTVAETIRTVLKQMFGQQDPFFSKVQEAAVKNTVIMLKKVYGDNTNLLSVLRCLRDLKVMTRELELYEAKYGVDDLSGYFRVDVIGNQKFHEFSTGLRTQLEDILGNERIRHILLGKDSVNFDKHLADGGVLVVNTCIELGAIGDTFGQLITMSLQNAVFRRPGNEWTRRPHYLIEDEFPCYVNPDVARFLSVGRSYRCASIFAIQSLGQLDVQGYPGFRDTMLTNLRNKIIFGGMSYADAKYFSEELGEEKEIGETRMFSTILGLRQWTADRVQQKEEHKRRFTTTQLKELPKFHFVHQLLKDGQPCVPGLVEGKVIDKSAFASPPSPTAPKPMAGDRARPALALVTREPGGTTPPDNENKSSVRRAPLVIQTGQPIIKEIPQLPVETDEDWFLLRKEKKERRNHGNGSNHHVG